jgi:hypothetical protein
MNATIITVKDCTDVRFVYDRGIRNRTAVTYDAATRAYGSKVEGEYYAKAHIAYIGKLPNGTWGLFTADGDLMKQWLNNRGSAKVAAKRHFGEVMFS